MTITTGITREYKEVEREMEKEQVGAARARRNRYDAAAVLRTTTQ